MCLLLDMMTVYMTEGLMSPPMEYARRFMSMSNYSTPECHQSSADSDRTVPYLPSLMPTSRSIAQELDEAASMAACCTGGDDMADDM